MTHSLKIGTDQLWEVLRESQLLPDAEFKRLQTEAATLEHQDSDELAAWLVAEKAITPLHAKVLRSGHSGPFQFGRYRVIGSGPRPNVWLARDQKTSFPVWLHFFPGQSKEDLAAWDTIESRAEQLASISHPNLIRVYESIVTRDYRFVATAAGGAQSLGDRMPLKRRLNEGQAVNVVREVAAAVVELDAHSVQHGSLSLDHIFPNAKQKITRLLPPVTDCDSDSGTNTNALARLFYRLLTGRDAPEKKKLAKINTKKFVESLEAKKIRPRVSELLHEALTSGDSFKPGMFLERLEKLSKSKKESPQEQAHAREVAYLAGLVPWQENAPVVDDHIPELEPEIPSDENAANRPGVRTKRRQLPVAVPISLALLGFASLIGVGALIANLKKLDPPKTVVKKDRSSEAVDPSADAASAVANRRKEIETLLATQAYVQEIVADDSQTLWESPTTGFAIDITKTPPSPRMIAAVNWGSIQGSEFGLRSIKSLGPRMDQAMRQMESSCGFDVAQIESSIISLHSNLSFEYDSFLVIKLKEPVELETCTKNWGSPTATPGIEGAFAKGNRSWWVITDESEQSKVGSFVVGPTELVQQVANGEVAALSGTMLRLVESSDASRDVNLILPTISLFNTEGQKLFADQQKWMKELRLLLPDSVRGLSVSLHHDRGDYLELRVDNTKDLMPTEAASRMRDRFEEKLEQSRISLQEKQALPYWEPVRARYGAMLRELSSQLRWDSEFGEVIGNAWLPPGAIHNLFAATELAMTFEPTAKTMASTDKPQTPQSLEELLAAPRDLSIANPPDLNVLLKNIRDEVSDQYVELPFEFEIRIAGTDLQKDGITQNQRPGPLQIEDKSLSEILTQVMVSANPNREISGASDPNCKLVWVVIEDDQSHGKKIVLVTTRSAAAEKEFKLPDAFVAQP